MAKIPRCTSFNVCHQGLLERTHFTPRERTHLIKYHRQIKEWYFCRSSRKMQPLVRRPDHDMNYVCLCGKEMLLASSFRLHSKSCAHVTASLETESGVNQPNNGGNAPTRLADAYRFPPPLYRPRPPASAIKQGAPSKDAAPAAARSQALPPSIPTPSPSQPANPVRGNTPLQKVAKEDHPPQQQHRSKTFTPPPAQDSHRLQTPAGPKPPPPVQGVPPVQEHANAIPPPPLQGQQGKINRLDEILQSMAKQTQQFQTIAQIMAESMAEQANRLQSIERAAERSRLELLERITHVENSVIKAKEEQTELFKPLFGQLCDSLGQIEDILKSTEGKDSRLILQTLDEISDSLSQKKDSPAAGPDNNDISKLMAQQEQQFGLIQKAILGLKTEQMLHQRIVNETLLQTKFEQNQKLDTIVKSTDSNRERLRVLKQMLIVQRGALDRLDEGRACHSNSKPIKNEPTW